MNAFLAVVLAAIVPPAGAQTSEPAIEFSRPNGESVRLPLSAMKKKLKSHKVETKHAFVEKTKRYRGFKLADVLDLGFGPAWRDGADFSEAAFWATDGYESVTAFDKLDDSGGYVAYEDLDVAAWEPVGRKQADPGPFFLIWTGEKQTTAESYPWPWALAKVALIRFEDKYPRVVPGGADTASPAWRGYQTFKALCVRCHAIERQGGTVGPDLNAPKNILEYRTPDRVREFIYNPSKYRYTNMPDHLQLSAAQLDELIAYLRYLKDRPRPGADEFE